MDVGIIAGSPGILAAAFAALAAFCVAVELSGPRKRGESGAGRLRSLIPGLGLLAGKDKKTESSGDELDKTILVGEGEPHSDAESSLIGLKKDYLDGFSGPRLKYEVALTLVKAAGEPEEGKTEAGVALAAEAFMRATMSTSVEAIDGSRRQEKKTDPMNDRGRPED